MKFLQITILILLLNVSIAVINISGMFPGFNILPQQDWLDSLTSQASQNQQYFQSTATQQVSSSFGFGDFVRGLILFVETFVIGIVAPGYIFHAFGMTALLALLISLPIYPIYILGIAQLISNRNTVFMD